MSKGERKSEKALSLTIAMKHMAPLSLFKFMTGQDVHTVRILQRLAVDIPHDFAQDQRKI